MKQRMISQIGAQTTTSMHKRMRLVVHASDVVADVIEKKNSPLYSHAEALPASALRLQASVFPSMFRMKQELFRHSAAGVP